MHTHTLTLATVNGWLKSCPPIRRKPHGAGPSSTTVNGISTAGVCVCVECDGVFSSKSFWAEGRPLLQSEGYLSLSIFLPHFFLNNVLPYLSLCLSLFPSHLPLLSSTKFSFYFLHLFATLSISIYILICLITTNLNHINSISEQYINVRYAKPCLHICFHMNNIFFFIFFFFPVGLG